MKYADFFGFNVSFFDKEDGIFVFSNIPNMKYLFSLCPLNNYVKGGNVLTKYKKKDIGFRMTPSFKKD